MATQNLEDRVAALEAEVALLKRKRSAQPVKPWWEERWGVFKDDPMYDEAMRLGAEYRRSQPGPANENVPS